MYDAAIIGAGIIGSNIARELSKYDLKVILLEKDNDVSNGTTKANSGIVHAGYDAEPGTLKAKFNVLGNEMYEKLCRELEVPFRRIGSLVVATKEEDMETIEQLYAKGKANGVPDMKILSKEEAQKLESNLSDNIAGALYAATAGIVGSWEFAIALAENAVDNGVELRLNSEVKDIQKLEESYRLITASGEIQTKYVINAAGLFADAIHNMVSTPTFEIIPNRGQYQLFDKNSGKHVNTVVFQCPTKHGKGVVVLPTVHYNLLVGPNAEAVDSKDALDTSKEGMGFIKEKAKESVKGIRFNEVITSFSGLRAKTPSGDFIIEESKGAKGFINVAAIDSPGLTAAPAIAEYVVNLLKDIAGEFNINKNFRPNRRPSVQFAALSDEEKMKLIEKDPRYGRIICRCENITEGEIVDIIKRNAGATTVDGVKRRARPGSGRCQGGFCSPWVMEILARELNININEIVKDGKNSYILTEATKQPQVQLQEA
ncbi:glycerol-3-phosphate dehydrogenase [Natronincola peptidivorans]|uniref:Glycerol-3-phosphate dehydrogenase n=1 Tax=Natronincola peptidivorans TaxID=426128 RepID=A0A1I0D8S4_9FIRM|nr:NAD(P)/FAD-dependent oxidoreductase [Natronincola peptidivorans]SET28685.1 glycerol-3-phosphate dehydrogenase [Natronincola peptidivorans]